MSHVTYKWVMSHKNEWCQIYIGHVTYKWVMSHAYESRHIWMRHVTYKWAMSHIDVTYEWVALLEWVMNEWSTNWMESRTVWITYYMRHTTCIQAAIICMWMRLIAYVWVTNERVTNCDLHPGSHHVRVNEAYHICMSHKWTSHELTQKNESRTATCIQAAIMCVWMRHITYVLKLSHMSYTQEDVSHHIWMTHMDGIPYECVCHITHEISVISHINEPS